MGTAQALKKQNIKSGASKSVNRCSDPNICCSGKKVLAFQILVCYNIPDSAQFRISGQCRLLAVSPVKEGAGG